MYKKSMLILAMKSWSIEHASNVGSPFWIFRLYRYVTRTNISFFDPGPKIKERNIRARNITI